MKQQNLMGKNAILVTFVLGILLISLVDLVSATSDFVDLDEYDVEYIYNNAVAGSRFTLTVKITNVDNENKENIRFEFDEKRPFKFVGDDDWRIASLGVGESVTKNFRIEVDEDANSDDYELEFTLEDSREDYEDVFVIDVSSDKAELSIGDLQSDPKTILPDMKNIKLTVEIENSGDKDAKFVKAKLKLPQGFVPSSSYSDSDNIGTIKAGETKQAVFYIDTEKNLNSGLYNAKIELNYKNDNSENSENLDIDLPVQGIPQFSILSTITNPSEVMQGDSVTLKINILNNGKKEGKDTSIKVFEKSDQPFNFAEKTNFVGTINPGSTGTAVLEFNVDKDATPIDYLVTIQIRTVYNGEVLVSEETIPIKVYKYERTAEDYLKIGGLIIGGIFIILILLLVFKSKRRRK